MTNLNETYTDVLVTWVKESKEVRFSTDILNDPTSFEVEIERNNDQQSNIPSVYLNAIQRDRARQHVRDLMENRDLFEARAKVAELEQKKLLKENRFLDEINKQSLSRVAKLSQNNCELNKKNESLRHDTQRLKGLADMAEDKLEKSQSWTAHKK